MKRSLMLISALLPWGLRRRLLIALGHTLHDDSYIGLSLIAVNKLTLGRGARIGHLNIVRNLEVLAIGDAGRVGNLNWVSGLPLGVDHFKAAPARDPSLYIGKHAALTHRHLVDCTDAVVIGDFTTVAGYQTQILTHGIGIRSGLQECAPVKLGDYCLIGSGSQMLAGAVLPSYCLLAAGAVLTGIADRQYSVYGGVPARPIKALEPDHAYFKRREGYVD